MPTAKASLLFLLPLLIIMSFSSISMAAYDIGSDQSTLVTLKNHFLTTNPGNLIAQNWSTAASVCDWVGVSCGSRHRRVTALNMSHMGLTATVPSSLLGNLSFLVSLDLSNNNLYGNMPEDLSRLPRLRFINLYNNTFTGVIPHSFFNVSGSPLETLIISGNQLEGSIPPQIGNLSNLRDFYGGVNRFTGAIPSEIGNLRMLQYMYLGNNMLQGSIPEEIGNLENLEEIGLMNNSLSGSIPVGIFNISTLRSISFILNNLSGTLPPTLGNNLPNLQYLFLYLNHLTGIIPPSISNSSNLFQIALQHNNFIGSIPNSLGNLKELDCLHLYSNQLTNGDASESVQELSFLTALTHCPKLRDLVLSDNPLRGFLPSSIGNLSTSLVRIYASGCMIMGNIPDEIGNLSNVYNLDFTDNDLSGSIPTTALNGLTSLQGLFLGNNRIQGTLPNNLCDLPELSHLSLRYNQISGPIPDCMGNVTSLRKIYLASNRLSSSPPLGLWNLKDLLELDLSSNSITGNLPREIRNLEAATYINLSINSFTGVIPDSFESMLNLVNFSLASNKLQGSIPQSMGKMISLVSLDLSNNNLSGEIPKVLEGLELLTSFNVSFNKLSGEVPSGGPFKNFSYLSFISNEDLCGAPELHLPRCNYGSSQRKKRRIFLIVAVVIGSLIITALLVIAWIMRKHRRRKSVPLETGDLYHSNEVERFSYQQLKQATDDFSDENLLGSGSFGSVYRATFQNGILFAVKVFDLQQEYASKSFETECLMLSKLRHRNLTKVISACSNLDFKALLLEYMQNGSLEEWLYSDGHFLDILQRINVMIDVASALEYLHHGYMKPVIHCDLKPSNILLDRDMVGHVTDFGITKLLGEEESIVHTQTLATLGYMAPEYGMGGLVSTACDVYSYGILLLETFTRRRPSDDIFGGELSLRSWINSMIPHSVSQVVDPNLMREEEENFAEKMQSVSSIFSLAMTCTAESPTDRITIKNARTALEKIRLHLVATL